MYINKGIRNASANTTKFRLDKPPQPKDTTARACISRHSSSTKYNSSKTPENLKASEIYKNPYFTYPTRTPSIERTTKDANLKRYEQIPIYPREMLPPNQTLSNRHAASSWKHRHFDRIQAQNIDAPTNESIKLLKNDSSQNL